MFQACSPKSPLRSAISILFLAGAITGCATINTGYEQLNYEAGVLQETQFGSVSGFEDLDGQVLIWKGVPYAQSTAGDMRWKSPINPQPWVEVLDATQRGEVSVQSSWGKTFGSEDCLNLDIYRPNSEEKNLPVLVYIHGGNNQTGTSEELNGRHLAMKTNSIVVSVNYRLGLLGFNNLPALRSGNELQDSGNFTVLDIVKSLDWVGENISSFGGNPDNITLSGFSAGGRDVMALLISPIAKGKFHKAISISGGMTLADYDASAELIAKAIAPLAVDDGRKATIDEAYEWLMSDAVEVKDYLYGLQAERLAGLMSNAGIRMAAFPHLYNDGHVLPEEGYQTTEYNDVPLIMITGSDEFSLFSRFDRKFTPAVKDDELLTDSDTAMAYQFVKNYGSELYGLFNAQESAEKMFDAYDAPIYTTEIAYGGDASVVGEKMAQLFGSFHGIWMPFLVHEPSGFSGLYANSFANDGAKDLADQFTQYVGHFLWTGNPNAEHMVTWDAWTSADEGPTHLLFDADTEKAMVAMTDERRDYQAILAAMEADDSVSDAVKDELIENVLSGRWFSYQLDQHFGNTAPWVGVQ